MNTPKPIGILGGTFDPVHFGHLRTALELKQILDLQEIKFLPCHTPVHKELPSAHPHHRIAMLQLAIANESGFALDDRELRRATPSYMIETLTSLRQELNDTPLILIMGSDAFTNLPTWKNWQQLLDMAHIAVAIRAGKKMALDSEMLRFVAAHQELDVSGLHDTPSGNVFLQEVTALDIASSTIRCQLEAGYNPRFLLPDAVLHYIHENKLY